ncbi:MAG: arginyltransferase [Porticoccaceae bacterium]|nr:arginyltransferase [Porticoccaceae bacterium]
MTRDISPDLNKIRLFYTQPHQCSYLAEKEATTAFVDPTINMSPELYNQLTQMGYRRSGRYYYQPRCQQCSACISTRIPVADFKPSRQQRRCLKHNDDLAVETVSAIDKETEHYRLYEKYISLRHRDGDMFPPSWEQYVDFLGEGIKQTRFIEFRSSGVLLACSVVDFLHDGLSAIYTYYDPEHERRSLGTLAILTTVELARTEQLPYVYLGYWIKSSPKMAYKSRFQPLELLMGGRWVRCSGL